MSDVKLKLVKGTSYKINHGESLVVFISPQFVDVAQDIEEELFRQGVHATVFPIPPEDVKVFTVEHPLIVQKTDLNLKGLDEKAL